MAVDQKIQTTITAGRSSRKSPTDFDQGPIMVILLSCLAVAMCFTTLGMGLVNIARGNIDPRTPPAAPVSGKAESVKPVIPLAKPVPLKRPDAETVIKQQEAKLQQAEEQISDQQQRAVQAVAAEKSTLGESAQRLSQLRSEEAQLSARIATARSGLSGNVAEERRQLEIQRQQEQELNDLRQQIAALEGRIQEIEKAIAAAQKTAPPTLVVTTGEAVWVECVADGVVLLPQGTHVEIADLIKGSGPFLKAVLNQQVQFLVRPEGFGSFQIARDAAEQHGALSVGYEPIDANWRVKLQQGVRR